jgi:hypothetical protein
VCVPLQRKQEINKNLQPNLFAVKMTSVHLRMQHRHTQTNKTNKQTNKQTKKETTHTTYAENSKPKKTHIRWKHEIETYWTNLFAVEMTSVHLRVQQRRFSGAC